MDLSLAASKISCPIYIVGGALDRVIPPDHAKKLYSFEGVAFNIMVSPSSNCEVSGDNVPPSTGLVEVVRV